MTDRGPHRRFLITGAAALGLASPTLARVARPDLAAVMNRFEAAAGGKLGVCIRGPRAGHSFDWRADERFGMASTFKALLAGAVLARVDAGKERLDRSLPVTKADMLYHAPVTERFVERGAMTVAQLCEATVMTSDNPAANILMRTLGGPAGVTAFARGLGDKVTRLDRWELELNDVPPGEVRDTTTPRAMEATMRKLVVGNALSPASRTMLTRWMSESNTGLSRLRKHLPAGWRAADKTGTGMKGLTGDLAVFWRPDGRPVTVMTYLFGSAQPVAAREAVFADIGLLAFKLTAD